MGNSSKRHSSTSDEESKYIEKQMEMAVQHLAQNNKFASSYNNDFNFYENNEPTLIAPYLFLGGSFGNRNPSVLKQLGITHVLNMAVELQPHYEIVNNKRFFRHKHIMADDTVHYNIRYHFEEAFQFIDEAVKTNTKVLVHCMMGISRSGKLSLNAPILGLFIGKKREITLKLRIRKIRFFVISNYQVSRLNEYVFFVYSAESF
jgi:hypothetical protein